MSEPDDLAGSQMAPSLSPEPPARSLLVRFGGPLPAWAPPLFFLLLGTIFLWRSLFTGDVFLPASLLGHVAPWKSTTAYAQLPAWNPLRWDGIGQFYPWRKFAAETIRSGFVPLWNPYQFSGTPFVANSQSAALYPGNLLFVLIPDAAYAFGWSALLHLTLCGWFTYLLLRRLRCTEIASLLGGVAFAYSAWQIAWLQLPTFLATSCWFPLLLRQIYGGMDSRLQYRPVRGRGVSPGDTFGIALVVGMMLLAGHLQIAFYGLLAGTSLAAGLLITRRASVPRVITWAGGLILGLMIAMPQLLPAMELSRISHRVGKPSAAGYTAYTEYGLPPAGITSLLLPNITGGDTDPANLYWGYYRKRFANGSVNAVLHNPNETAVYVGILPLLLGLFACARGLGRVGFDRRTAFFCLLGALALLLAFGTPANALLYYGIPGFAQSGSPARCLVLWALALSALAALGADQLQKRFASERELAIVFGIFIAVLGIGLNLTTSSLTSAPPGVPFLPTLGDVLSRISADWARLALFSLAALALFAWPLLHRPASSNSQPVQPQPELDPQPTTSDAPHPLPNFLNSTHSCVLPAALALVAVDLFWTGMGSNPTAKREQVYPETRGITYLREHAGHNRIFPVNQRWSLFAAPTVSLRAVLPPNAATVFGLRDVQGYDSLFSGSYKAYANGFARPNRLRLVDASPQEVGNIVFFQNANAPGMENTGAAYVLSIPYDAPGFDPDAVPPSTPVETGDPGMMVYALPNGGGRANLTPMTSDSTLTWLEDRSTRVTLEVAAQSQSSLMLRDSNMPGWRVRVDGRMATQPPENTHPVARKVSLPPGRHIVSFRYEPQSFRLGVYATLAVLCLLAIFISAYLVQGAFAVQTAQSVDRQVQNDPHPVA